MKDVFSKSKRSEVMSKIRGKNTKPELTVRKFLFAKGLRFRIHSTNLPGKPDIVLKKHNTVVFVHGCFWHGHAGCKYFKFPKNNAKFWKNKIRGNIEKDSKNKKLLRQDKWKIITIWECSLKPKKREKTLNKLFSSIISLKK